MINIHIVDSYKVWDTEIMQGKIKAESSKHYDTWDARAVLNRSWISMYIEWYLHNFGYYLTLPFKRFYQLNKINLRCKDLDLERHS